MYIMTQYNSLKGHEVEAGGRSGQYEIHCKFKVNLSYSTKSWLKSTKQKLMNVHVKKYATYYFNFEISEYLLLCFYFMYKSTTYEEI